MIIVTFNDVSEFITELESSPLNLFEKVLRVTRQFRSSGAMPLTHLAVLASFITMNGHGWKLVQLSRYCGEFMRHETSPKAIDLADAAIKQLEEAAQKFGLTVKAGVYSGQPEQEGT